MDGDALFQALTRVHPRSLQVLLARFVADGPGGPGRDRSAFARFYGIDPQAADVLLWRAAVDFEAALTGQPPPGPLPFDEEVRAAVALADALDDPLLPVSPSLAAQTSTLRALSSHAAVLRERLAAAERAELESPAYARETWLRRIAIVVVLALSGWLYFKDDLVKRWRQWTSPVTRPSSAR